MMSLPALLRRLLARLFTRPCRSCTAPVGRYADLCPTCVEHLPVGLRWAFREARDWRLLYRDTYRRALAEALAWLPADPESNAETTTPTVKEKP